MNTTELPEPDDRDNTTDVSTEEDNDESESDVAPDGVGRD